jgi:hypothetical protein
VTHELGHSLGLGGATDVTSPMNETLPTGTSRRTMSVADLNIAEAPTGADPLTAAVFGDHEPVVAPTGITRSVSLVQLTGVPVVTPVAIGSLVLPVSVPTAATAFQRFILAPANELSIPSGAAGLFCDSVSNPVGESDALRQAWEGWSRLEMQPADARPVGDQAAPDATGPSLEKDSDAFWSPAASPQHDLLPSDDFLLASAVNRVFAEWEANEMPILRAPETGSAINREVATGDTSNLAWAGLLAMMVGARVPVQQAAKRSQRVALKR